MYEAFFLAALAALVILALRRKSIAILDNPVVIHRPGLYYATLAPQLVLSQNFIKHIARNFFESESDAGDIATQHYEVSAERQYLLAVGLRAGMLYFQAIMPSLNAADSSYLALHQFSEQVLVHHPLTASADTQGIERLRLAVDQAAKQLKITCQSLNPES